MDFRIAIDLACRCLEYPRPGAFRQAQHIDRAMNRRLDGLHGVRLVVNRARGAGQIVDAVDLEEEREGHIMPDDLEMRIVQQVKDVGFAAGIEIIDTDDEMTLGEQPLAQMAAKESRAASDKYRRHGKWTKTQGLELKIRVLLTYLRKTFMIKNRDLIFMQAGQRTFCQL